MIPRLPRLGASVLLVGIAFATNAAQPAKASRGFPVEYVKPEHAKFLRFYDGMRERRILERLSEALAFIRLPTPLTLRTAECGESNAMYDEEDHTATFCYEYVAELVRDSAAAQQKGFTREEAVIGPFVFIYLHEIGHAVFHLLKVPVLGREEDAADQVATVILLRMGPEIAKRTLATAAWMYAQGARAHQADESDFSDVHPLDAQRYYNVLCLAYGSDPKEYAAAAQANGLPQDRAEGCESEYKQVAYAVRTLIAPHVDAQAFRTTVQRAKARRQSSAAQRAR